MKHVAVSLLQKSHLAFLCVSFLLLLCCPMATRAEPLVLPESGNQAIKLKEKDLAVRERLAEMIESIQKNPQYGERMTRLGQERTIFCSVCHGKDGNSVRPGVPNLASQNPVYLLDQFQRFSDGRRYDRAMSLLSETFSEDEKVLLALYYSSLKVKSTESNSSGHVLRGKKIYDMACAQCHGENGRGDKGYAHLAGQKSDYVVKMLNEFRSYTGRRANPWMTVVTNSLSREQISDVAMYVSTLK